MEGILIIDKPNGMTSHDVVSRVRKQLKIKRVGHAGTLDPLATGVLVVLVGKATKLFDKFVGLEKAYRSTMLLGTVTDTADIEGRVIEKHDSKHVSSKDVEQVLDDFRGEILQLPPMYSAVKYKGKKLYELARKGITVEREPRRVRINALEVLDYKFPEIEFYLECSKGTYVRQLADDIGRKLGCGACITQIQRTKVGSFDLNQAVRIEDIHEDHIRPWTN